MALLAPPPVTLRLITDANETLSRHCSLCLYFHHAQSTCPHGRKLRRRNHVSSRPATPSSFYTAEEPESPVSSSTAQAKTENVFASVTRKKKKAISVIVPLGTKTRRVPPMLDFDFDFDIDIEIDF